MKKQILLSFILILCCSAVNAINNRVFEIGTDVGVGVTNSYFSINDLFFNKSKVLELDFNKIANATAANGFELGGIANADVFLNLNFGKTFSLGVFAGIDGSLYANIPGSLIKLIADGNSLGKPSEGTFDIKASLFAAAGLNTVINRGKISVGLRPSLFVPIVYAREGMARYSVVTNADGTVNANAGWEIPVYSVFNMENGISLNNFPLAEIMQIGGFDLSASINYQILPNISVTTLFANIPILPATCDYRMMYRGSMDFKMNSLLDVMEDDSKELIDRNDFSADETATETNAAKKIYRPFEVGVSVEFRPFKTNAVAIIPDAALVFENGVIDYYNYGITGKADIKNMLKASLFVLQRQHIWKAGMTAGVNLRVIELDFSLAAYFPAFGAMFSGTGLYAGLGVRIGL